MREQPLISLVDVTLSFGKNVLVEDFSASIFSGESVSIIGRSGSGKTTLLRSIAGLHDPRAGSITIGEAAPKQLYGTGKIQFLHQRPVLFDHLTVAENVALSGRLAQQPQLAAAEAQHLLDSVGLWSARQSYPFELSEGMKARLALARAFVTSPDVLLVDEPFASLDFLRREALNRQLLSLAQEHSTVVVVVTHDLSDALRFTSRAIVFAAEGRTPKLVTLPGDCPSLDPNALLPAYLEARDVLLALMSGESTAAAPA